MGGGGGEDDVKDCFWNWNSSDGDPLGDAWWIRIGGACSRKGELVVLECGETATNCVGDWPRSAAETGSILAMFTLRGTGVWT